MPVAAQDANMGGQLPRDAGEQPRNPNETLPPPQARSADPSKEPLIPPAEQLFRLDSEPRYVERENERRRQLRQDPSTPQEMRNELVDVQFPAHERQVDQPYKPRVFAAQEVLVEPNYVCYRKLLFEDKNTERYGWTLGPLQPLASFGQFYTDFTWAPYRWASYPCLRHECSAGLCLPGDPVPMMKYPPGLSLSGGLMQGVAVTALYVLVP